MRRSRVLSGLVVVMVAGSFLGTSGCVGDDNLSKPIDAGTATTQDATIDSTTTSGSDSSTDGNTSTSTDSAFPVDANPPADANTSSTDAEADAG
jgi:hypothetical protein